MPQNYSIIIVKINIYSITLQWSTITEQKERKKEKEGEEWMIKEKMEGEEWSRKERSVK